MGKKKGKNKKSKEVLGDGVTIKDENGNVISYISPEECREIVTDLYVKLFNAVQDGREVEEESEVVRPW
jgi:hypothetical protein